MAVSRLEGSVVRNDNDWVYGNGIDGDVTISGTVTLTSDKYYNTLNVPVGNVLLTNGYRIFVKGQAIINGVVGIGQSDLSTPGIENGPTSEPPSSVATGTVSGTSSPITYRTGGQGGGGSNPAVSLLPEYLVERVSSLSGVAFDAALGGPFPIELAGGSAGTGGSNGTPATSYTNASPAPSGFTNTWPGKAGSPGSDGSAGSYPPNAHSVGSPGGRGHAGSAGTDGSAPNPPVAATGGTGGAGGQGGGVVAIIAKTIIGNGIIMSIGRSGSTGSAGTTSPAGPNGSTGASGSTAPSMTVHHHHSAVIHEPHTHGGHHHHGPGNDKLYGPHGSGHSQHTHNHSATIHAPCCTVSPGHHYPGGAGGAGGAGGSGSPAVTGGTGKRGGAGGGGTIIIITEETPSDLNYDVRPGETEDADNYLATSGSIYVILNK